jgi:TolB protein
LNEEGVSIQIAKVDEDPAKIFMVSDISRPAFVPSWSPDGTQLAYLVLDPFSQKTNFYLLDNLTGDSRQLSTEAINLVGSYCWTYDQKYLVWGYTQPNGAEMDIYRLEVSNGEIMDLTEESKVWDAFPACSPTGDQIAFVSDRSVEGKETDNIWVVDSQGENLQQLTNTPGWENKYPAWSPDGTEIVFFRGGIFGDEADGPAGLWSVKADGSGERLIRALKDFIFTAREGAAVDPG